MQQKVSLIATVLNEESSIAQFMGSIKSQTMKPDEVLIVDGGSIDNTISIIEDLSSIIKLKVKIIRKKGNRSLGRNTAIKASSNTIIAVTDAGCVLDSHWLARITKPFEDGSVDVVAGFYKPRTNSIFEQCLSTYTCTMKDRFDKNNFLPSSRSVAFKKEAWEKVKGYPENLDTCEDLVFDNKLKAAGFKFVTQEKAFVWWPQRKNIVQAAKQFYLYAKGDGQAHYWRRSTPFLFLRYTAGIVFLIFILITNNYKLVSIIFLLILFYLVWAIIKNYKYVKKPQAFFYLPLLQLVSDLCVISGTIVGLSYNLWDTKGKQ